MNQDPSAINRPVIKACAAWGGAGVANVADAATAAVTQDAWGWLHAVPWGQLASLAAFAYSALLLVEWLWKKVLRPLAWQMGWLKRPAGLSESEWAALRPGAK